MTDSVRAPQLRPGCPAWCAEDHAIAGMGVFHERYLYPATGPAVRVGLQRLDYNGEPGAVRLFVDSIQVGPDLPCSQTGAMADLMRKLGRADVARAIEKLAQLAAQAAGQDGAQLCRKCRTRPVTSGTYAPDFCDQCIDLCHEALEFDHICMICASPDEARARGWEVSQ